ncbi:MULTISPECIES: DUF2252 domain-containing protein [unclassified Amycolatopsis]|uniref:DUF2252 domain-containing protein n=1 Tax=unclassified Amycolatopsis TaxID=2618356 RepID=UPI003452BED1
MVLTSRRSTVESREDRIARGKAARAAAPRSSHAGFTRERGRPGPLELLARQDETRVKDLLPIRYGRMAVSPFTYFRGAALPMASDLSGTPVSGLRVQACGDAHLMNFGVFASPERKLVFDINDFDETLPGPWEWDVKRLAASLEIASRDNGFSARQCRGVVLATIAQYRKAMRDFGERTALDVWYAHADVDQVEALYADRLGGHRRRMIAKGMASAQAHDNLGALRRFTSVTDGTVQIKPDPPIVLPLEELAPTKEAADEVRNQMGSILKAYRATLEPERRVLLDRYRIVDMAHKVVGVGSVGTRCWMVLLLGNDDRDPLFLQAKEAGPSVLEEFAGASDYDNSGRRVVVGQRLMQTVSDIFLGWVHVTGVDERPRDFYLRQLRDWKGSANVESMDPRDLRTYGMLCAWTLARAHARTGDSVAIGAYVGSGDSFDHAIAEFTHDYADQNEKDHTELTKAIKTGAVKAESGR